jgi:hypothetical protein
MNEQTVLASVEAVPEVITEHRPAAHKRNGGLTYIRLDVSLARQIGPDWAILAFLVAHMFELGREGPNGRVKLTRPLWHAAGILTADRRKKVLDHLADKLPRDLFILHRNRGRCAEVARGPKWMGRRAL